MTESGAEIDIEDDDTVHIHASKQETLIRTKAMIASHVPGNRRGQGLLRQGGFHHPVRRLHGIVPDPWKRQLFLALARRHGLSPFPQNRQRYRTVMPRATASFTNKVLWPEFLELSKLLLNCLDEANRDIITHSVPGDLSEAVEQPQLPH